MLSRSLHPRPRGAVRRFLAALVRVLRTALVVVLVGPARGFGATPQIDDPDVRDHPEETHRDVSPDEATAHASARTPSGRPPAGT